MFRGDPQERVVTDDAALGAAQASLLDPVQVFEISSYPESEGFIVKRSHGPPPVGESYVEDRSSTSRDASQSGALDDEIDVSKLSTGGIALVPIITGGFSLYLFTSSWNEYLLLIGLLLIVSGLGVFGYAGYLYRSEDWTTAWTFLANTGENESQS